MIKTKKEHSDFEKAQWGSHTEVIIDYIMKNEKIDTMLELGSGEFSTPVYAPLVDTLCSVETDKEWYEYMQTTYPITNVVYKHLSPINIPFFLEDLNMLKQLPTLVLVDHTHEEIPNQRALIANQLMKLGCKYIVIHDSCESIVDGIELNDNYNYSINSKSINPSLLLSRK